MADGLNPAEHFVRSQYYFVFPVVKLRRNTTRGGECQVANLTGVKHILSAFVRRQTSRALLRSMSVKLTWMEYGRLMIDPLALFA